MLNVAVPVTSRVPVPSVVLPTLKLTVPVGVPPFNEVTVTIAVNVTSWPTLDGFGAELSKVAVVPLSTVCVSVADVLPAYCTSPPYTALIDSEPAGKLVVVNVACPELSVPVPRMVGPCLKVTVPVAADGLTLAVNATGCPTKDGFNDGVSEVVVAVWDTTF